MEFIVDPERPKRDEEHSEDDLDLLSTGQAFSKRQRLALELSPNQHSREARWNQYRVSDTSNLSTLTEASDTPNNNKNNNDNIDAADDDNDDDEIGGSIHISAEQVENIHLHVESLASELSSWSLTNLKEWRRRQHQHHDRVVEKAVVTDDPMEICHSSFHDYSQDDSMTEERSEVNLRQRQRAAQHEVMRTLRHG